MSLQKSALHHLGKESEEFQQDGEAWAIISVHPGTSAIMLLENGILVTVPGHKSPKIPLMWFNDDNIKDIVLEWRAIL